jgi:hypothetical protein
MKKWMLSLLFLPLSVGATGVSVVENSHHKWDIYYTTPSGKRFFLYEDQNQPDTHSGPGEPLFYETRGNIFSILHYCFGNFQSCSVRYINISSNQISPVIMRPALQVSSDYYRTLGPLDNLNQNIVVLFNYPSDWQYTMTPIFEPCKHLFVYPLQHLSDGPDVGSAFLPNGDLYLNMMVDQGPNQSLTIPIDYKKLYADCAS